jgi:SAM-dependent MidA family methyltransferase
MILTWRRRAAATLAERPTYGEPVVVGWRVATQAALYGSDGFFVRPSGGPAAHFRTSVHASPLFTGALAAVVGAVFERLDRPAGFQVVDVGAGRGELLTALRSRMPELRYTGVEMAPRPDGLDPGIRWRTDLPPDGVTGVVLATEWLDNVPVDVAEVDDEGRIRRVLVDRATGDETLGPELDAADRFWLARWWPLESPGERAEIGWPRDAAWANAVGGLERGLALAVDYGHRKDGRPPFGTLSGFRDGRQVPPVPDGRCDVTAHVAMDAAAAAAGTPYGLISQREALRALGVDGGRPPLELASSDPATYLRRLAGAGAAAELTDPAGLGGHWWLAQGAGIDPRGMLEPHENMGT